MRCIAATLGAPVIEPHGNNTRKTSTSVVAGGTVAVMVDVICHTVS
jgi:hypothetical protein